VPFFYPNPPEARSSGRPDFVPLPAGSERLVGFRVGEEGEESHRQHLAQKPQIRALIFDVNELKLN